MLVFCALQQLESRTGEVQPRLLDVLLLALKRGKDMIDPLIDVSSLKPTIGT